MDAWRRGYESRFSAVNQRPLDAVEGMAPEVKAALRAVGVVDAPQLVALAASEPVRTELARHLGLTEKALTAIVNHARGAVPAYLAAAVDAPREQNHGLGAIPPPDEVLARAAAIPLASEAAAPVALPPAANLASGMPEIREQADRGTCVAFALTALHEFYLRARGRNRNLSEQDLYFRTKQRDGFPNECGTFQSVAVEVLRTSGQCREKVWPYNPNLPCNQGGPAPAKADADAAKHKIRFRQLNPQDVDGIKAALADDRPVTISIPVWNSWYSSADTFATGRITMRIGNESGPNGQPAGHAVCLIGYQDDAQYPGGGYFILRNSWGEDWASQSPYGPGNGTIPYQYIANENWEAYTIRPEAAAEPTLPADEAAEGRDIEPSPTEERRRITIRAGGVTITID